MMRKDCPSDKNKVVDKVDGEIDLILRGAGGVPTNSLLDIIVTLCEIHKLREDLDNLPKDEEKSQ
jgi:hypothetical protein